MIADLLREFRWYLSLGNKFIKVVPVMTALIVVLTLVSQVAALLAYFLPLKVIIMLGSEGIPRYFPDAFKTFDRDTLVMWLGLSTLFFYLLHTLSESAISRITGVASSKLIESTQKLMLFDNQNVVASKAYLRHSRATSGVIFVVFSLIALGFFYTAISVVIVSYLTTACATYFLLSVLSLRCREWLNINFSSFINTASALGFFLVFAYLVTDFVFKPTPGIIAAIVALILSKQVMSRVGSMITDAQALSREKIRINALFFHNELNLPSNLIEQDEIWTLLRPESREQWTLDVLQRFIGPIEKINTCQWLDIEQKGVFALIVKHEQCHYLVKLYRPNCRSQLLHEIELTENWHRNLPAPEYLGATKVKGYDCLVYRLGAGRIIKPRERNTYVENIDECLLHTTVPKLVLNRFIRSKPMLWQRIDVTVIERMWVAVQSPKQKTELQTFLKNTHNLQNILMHLPASIASSDSKRISLWLNSDHKPMLLHWGNWSLEPVGAGWPVGRKGLETLSALEGNSKSKISGIEPVKLQLAALSYALEKRCQTQRLSAALALLPEINHRLDLLAHPKVSPKAAGISSNK